MLERHPRRRRRAGTGAVANIVCAAGRNDASRTTRIPPAAIVSAATRSSPRGARTSVVAPMTAATAAAAASAIARTTDTAERRSAGSAPKQLHAAVSPRRRAEAVTAAKTENMTDAATRKPVRARPVARPAPITTSAAITSQPADIASHLGATPYAATPLRNTPGRASLANDAHKQTPATAARHDDDDIPSESAVDGHATPILLSR